MENNHGSQGDRSSTRENASSVIINNTLILGIVQNAGVLDEVVEPVARSDDSVVGGINRTGWMSRGNMTLHIKRS